MECICAICGEEMQAEIDTIRPGSNEPFMKVTPCCDTEYTSDILHDLREVHCPDLEDQFEAVDIALTDVLERIPDDTMEEYFIQDLKNTINSMLDIIKEITKL